ncbi:MAG: TolC family protein [Flavobacteriaceae bacterium]|nr:TolC family protein [Flavobacteriaceae bacterium]
MKILPYIVTLLIGTYALAQKPVYNLGILLDNRTESINPLLIKMENQIKAVVGEDAIIQFSESNILVNNYNLEEAEKNYNQLVNTTDLILAFGVVNSVVVNKQIAHRKPTILFGAVNNDFNQIDLTKSTSGVKNFTYLIESESFIEDLKVLKQLTGFSKVGIVIDDAFAEILPLKPVFDKELNVIDADYKLIPFKTLTDITSNLDGIDAVYIAGGFFLTDDETKRLANTLKEKKLPSFTINSIDDVELGIMATNQAKNNLDQFFRRVALTIESFVNGTPLADMPVFIDYNARLTINFNTANAVNVPIRYSLITKTDFVGQMKNINAQKIYDLKSVMEEAIEKNLVLQSSKKDVEISEQNLKSSRANYLPSLTANAAGMYIDPKLAEISNGQNPEFSTTGNVTLQQTIFNAEASANNTIQKELLNAQQESYNADELNTIFEASNTYFNALILKANAQIQMRNLDLTKQNLQIAQENFEAGESGKSDVLRFRSELAQNTQNMIEAINQMEQGFIGLNQVLNNPLDTQIDVENAELNKGLYKDYNYDLIVELLDNPVTKDAFVDFLVAEAKINAPELKSLDYNLKATERSIKLNGSNRFLPTVALQGQYNHTFDRSGKGSTAPPGFELVDTNYNVGVNVSIPVFNRNLNNINKQTAILQKEQIALNRDNSTLNIDANVRNGVLNLINQIANIELSKLSESTAKDALDLIQESYKQGAVNFIQLIDAQNNYLNAQIASVTAVYNFLIASVQLERSIGYYFILNSKSDNDNFNQRFQEYLLSKK